MNNIPVKKSAELPFLIISFFLTTAIFNFIWWFYLNINNDQQNLFSQSQQTELSLLYTISLSTCIFIGLNKIISTRWQLIPVSVALTVAYYIGSQQNWKVLLLLLLFPVFLILLPLKKLGLISIYGLIDISFMAGFVLPSVLLYLQNGHFTKVFLNNLILLSLTFTFFLVGIFIPSKTQKLLISSASGIALIADCSINDLNVWFFGNLILIILTWLFLNKLTLRQKYRLPFFSLIMLFSNCLTIFQINA
ncbi:hypothetical protein FCS83_00860 [Oenococcus sp. UCMA 17063]|nr:hypothetical protein [Oenococcus sp. UCMA 17063]